MVEAKDFSTSIEQETIDTLLPVSQGSDTKLALIIFQESCFETNNRLIRTQKLDSPNYERIE